MPYIPHTQDDIDTMLNTIGIDSIEQLFDEIPDNLRCDNLTSLPTALNEMEIGRLMQERAAQTLPLTCFVGAGAYEHHIPAAVWEITTRGEFYSAYTPYQAEASQGTLQVIYEYQTMIAKLTGQDAANASLYDGASALAEAVLMAVRVKKAKIKHVLIPKTVHPIYRRVVHTLVENQAITISEIDYDAQSGQITVDKLAEHQDVKSAALIIPQPNFFGHLEAVDELTNWAHQRDMLVIAVVNPLSLALLKPPIEWGEKGADIVCGEGQPLGIPLSYGGPYFGFMSCKKAYIRQLPGRIVGRTTDTDGKTGYALTLQAREQHIRRSKATSNICTNQGLMVTAATIYMSLLGAKGLENTALACHHNTTTLVQQLQTIDGVDIVFNTPYFHETVIRINKPVADVLKALTTHQILGGYDLSQHYPELGNVLLICATEMRTEADIQHYVESLREIL